VAALGLSGLATAELRLSRRSRRDADAAARSDGGLRRHASAGPSPRRHQRPTDPPELPGYGHYPVGNETITLGEFPSACAARLAPAARAGAAGRAARPGACSPDPAENATTPRSLTRAARRVRAPVRRIMVVESVGRQEAARRQLSWTRSIRRQAGAVHGLLPGTTGQLPPDFDAQVRSFCQLNAYTGLSEEDLRASPAPTRLAQLQFLTADRRHPGRQPAASRIEVRDAWLNSGRAPAKSRTGCGRARA